MRTVITGAGGLLGAALLAAAPANVEALGVDLADGDLSSLEGARAALLPRLPQAVIHCAAWTDVDGCTRDPERALLQNAVATRNVALVCRDLGARLLAMSTDYVFDGAKGAPYLEDDPPNPLNPYGKSKLIAERAVQELVQDSLVVRTQWLFGPGGRNFVAAVVSRARQEGTVRVVADQFGSPTYTADLAGALWVALSSGAIGVLHLTNSGSCSWADLAAEALAAAGLSIVALEAIPAAQWPSPTLRPAFSALSNARWRELGFPPLRPWQEAVGEYVRRYLSATPDRK